MRNPAGNVSVLTGYDFRDSKTSGRNNGNSGAGQRPANELKGNYSTTVLADAAVATIRNHAAAKRAPLSGALAPG